MNVCWATDYEGIGNSYGYAVHNARSREALARAGIGCDPAARVAVHVAPSHLFRPLLGKFNVLYTAWETEHLPAAHRDGIARADAVIVTASFLLDVVRREFPDKPVFLCHLGVDTRTFWAVRREKPRGRPFRFLWVGAPNARKGWEVAAEAWRAFADEPRAELYVKTTVSNAVERCGNVIFDSRNLPAGELAALYRSAHAFIFPSFGEGFGLTMAEAMATGLPVAYTPCTSLTDLSDETCGYPLRFKMTPAWATREGGLSTADAPPEAGAVRTRLAQADPASLAERMIEIMGDYRRAGEKGLRAARRVREQFMWERTGRRLAAILEEIGPCQAQICVRAMT